MQEDVFEAVESIFIKCVSCFFELCVCRPMRGQVPPAVLKCITRINITPTPKGGYEPFFKVSRAPFLSYDPKIDVVLFQVLSVFVRWGVVEG